MSEHRKQTASEANALIREAHEATVSLLTERGFDQRSRGISATKNVDPLFIKASDSNLLEEGVIIEAKQGALSPFNYVAPL